ncbi:lytic murein transglycosylase [Nocardioides sp. AE5]|uniref:lytic transglycosylase domain-containing protein n=1 Tax=Nocardioides sp. AE5 TaxID=2962573 RepID=UPI002881DC72|nr:lytic murein transglycosylase [Nocardioides sp. AE5]MDT0203306.1 lytic murein transglycosylase [Nocardioides sp. AE5]
MKKKLPVRLLAVVGAYVVLVALISVGLLAALHRFTPDPGPVREHVADQVPRQLQELSAPTQGQVKTEAVAPAAGSSSLVDPAWVARVAAVTGIPEPAVRAYGHATLRMAAEQPRCGLGWTTLAGIGQIESQHGTIDSRTLGEDGRSSREIYGPALNGTNGFAAIRATPESTRWHGDPQWDHAIGPMQFIPSTWARWGADGDGDGTADPHDIDDAAWAAARYLCADGRRLDSDAWGRAIFSYNHSADYVHAVHRAALTYASRAS